MEMLDFSCSFTLRDTIIVCNVLQEFRVPDSYFEIMF